MHNMSAVVLKTCVCVCVCVCMLIVISSPKDASNQTCVTTPKTTATTTTTTTTTTRSSRAKKKKLLPNNKTTTTKTRMPTNKLNECAGDTHNELPPTYVAGWHDLDSVRRLTYRPLGVTDLVVAQISIGAAHVAESGGDCAEGVEAIREAIRLGINLVDTSPYYGASEIVVGQALKTIPREAYYIATKVGRLVDFTFDFSRPAILRSVEQSAKRLGVQCIDLLQLHDVEFADIDQILNESLPTLRQLQIDGKIRYIGITGYSLSVLKEIESKSSIRIDTILSYCRHCLFDTELRNYFNHFCSPDRTVGIINASVFGMGLYSLSRPIPFWHPAPQSIKDKCQEAAKLCETKGVPIQRLALLHSLQESRIGTHLIGMETVQMARLNVETAAIAKIDEVDAQILDEIQQLFSKLSITNWEGVEPEKYRTDPVKFAEFFRNGPQTSIAPTSSTPGTKDRLK